ncbi:MAG: hypothetical protein ACLU92_12720 [Coprococcus comes]
MRLYRGRIQSYELPEETGRKLTASRRLNADESKRNSCTASVPDHIDEDKIIRTISPDKDVDGLSCKCWKTLDRRKGFLSCTPAGIIQLLKRSKFRLKEKNV